MSERNGIEIDYCSQCRGVWLDRGELDKIIERSAQPVQRSGGEHQYTDKKYYDQPYVENKKHYPYKKKDSFLGDLFDF